MEMAHFKIMLAGPKNELEFYLFMEQGLYLTELRVSFNYLTLTISF